MDKHTISYYSKSDGKKLKRPYDPNPEKQYEFTAKSTGNLCKRYWDASKNGWRTAKSRWKISPVRKKLKKVGPRRLGSRAITNIKKTTTNGKMKGAHIIKIWINIQ